MDEFGSRIQHSDEPNIRIVPFVYQTSDTMYTYSLIYLLNDLEHEGNPKFIKYFLINNPLFRQRR